jgi:tRNA threonylcarbamoyladenosine biosynthesis protein TsaB
MTRILSIETATSLCSAAIHEDGKLVVVSEIHESQSHAAKLAVQIEQLFLLAGIKPHELNAVAVSSGPGSYTGLRIGVSTAKGICFAQNIPLLGVDSLAVIAWRAVKQQSQSGLFCPLIDARRMEAYCCLFNESLAVVEPVQAKILDENSFEDVLNREKVNFFGDALDKLTSVIRHPNAVFLHNIYPSASELGELAYKKFEAKQYEDLVHYEPLYLKEFLVKKSTKLDGVLNK